MSLIFAVQIPGGGGGGNYKASFIPFWIRACLTRKVRVHRQPPPPPRYLIYGNEYKTNYTHPMGININFYSRYIHILFVYFVVLFPRGGKITRPPLIPPGYVLAS